MTFNSRRYDVTSVEHNVDQSWPFVYSRRRYTTYLKAGQCPSQLLEGPEKIEVLKIILIDSWVHSRENLSL